MTYTPAPSRKQVNFDDLLGGPSPEEIRVKLLGNGYACLPARGKKVELIDWSTLCPTEADVRGWSKDRPQDGNTGIFLGAGLVAVDIDVEDASLSAELAGKARLLGDGVPLERVGKAPKRALLYRTAEPVRKHFTSSFDAGERDVDGKPKKCQVEVLGNGQQCIAFGVHPDTEKPYQWTTESPLDVPVADLPLINLKLLDDFMAAAEAVLARAGRPRLKNGAPRVRVQIEPSESGDYERKTIAELGAIVDDLPPGYADDYATWWQVGLVLHRETSGSDQGYALFERFSRTSEKFRERDVKAKWRSFFRAAESANPVTLGTLIHAGTKDREARRAAEIDKSFEDLRYESGLFKSAADWAGREPPPREWLVEDWIPHPNVTALYGDGATGKSTLALQLVIATAAGLPTWLGLDVKRHGPAVFITAEDDENEVWRRTIDVENLYGLNEHPADFYHMTFGELGGDDEGPVLARHDARTGMLVKTALFKNVERELEALRPALLVLDPLANLYTGSQNDPGIGTQFVTMLRRWAVRFNCTVLICAHPSMSGMSSGKGTGGTVAWSNSVRSRLYFTRLRDKDGNEPDEDARELTRKKSNHAKQNEKIALRWHNGTYIKDADAFDEADATPLDKWCRVFLNLLKDRCGTGLWVSPNVSNIYAPSIFAGHPDSERCSKEQFKAAMAALLNQKRIVIGKHGKDQSSHLEIAGDAGETVG